MRLGGATSGGRAPAGALVATAAAGLLAGGTAGLLAWRATSERDLARAARHDAVAALESARDAAAAAQRDVERVRAAADLVAAAGGHARRAEALEAAHGDTRPAWTAAADALREARSALDTPAVREALARALLGLGDAELSVEPARAADHFRAAAELAGAGPSPLRARALVGLLEAGAGGEAEAALAAARQAVATAPDEPAAATTLCRALLEAAASERLEAVARRGLLEEAVERARGPSSAGEPSRLLALALERLAAAAPDQAPALLDEAVRARRALALRAPADADAGRALVRALIDLAAVDGRRALLLLDEATRLARQHVSRRASSIADHELLVAALEAEGRARADAGDHARARVSLEQALAAALAAPPGPAGDAGHERALVRLQLALAPVLARERDLPAARRALEDAARGARALLTRDANDRRAVADLVLALLHLASLDQEQGRADDARARLEEACATARGAPGDAGMVRALGLALWRLAALDLAAGALDEAIGRLEEALAATRAAGVRLDGLEGALEQARRRRELLRGDAPATPAEQLQQAYALLSLGDPAAALARFEAALTDPGVRADVTRGHLYQAARAAAQAGQRARALEWLAEDVRRRRDRIAALEQAVASGGLAPEARDAAGAERDRLLRHLEHARRAEPAFAELRAAPEFERAFAGP